MVPSLRVHEPGVEPSVLKARVIEEIGGVVESPDEDITGIRVCSVIVSSLVIAAGNEVGK